MDPLEHYKKHGYYHFKGLFPERTIQKLTDEIDRVIKNHPEVCTYEDWHQGNQSRILHKVSRFTEFSESFQMASQEKNVISLIESFYKEKALLCTDKINFKFPGARGFYPHQDMSGIWSDYTDAIAQAFIAIDKSDVENGCLFIAPGRHKEGMLGGKMVPMDERNLADMEFIPIHQEPGDVLVFDGFLPHKSAPNNSSKSRRTLLFTYTKESDGDLRKMYLSSRG